MGKCMKISRMVDIEAQTDGWGAGYRYSRHRFVKGDEGYRSDVAFVRIPAGKAAFPLHYHEYSEETFYIISGKGALTTSEGEFEVSAGDIAFFPSGEEGAHKLVNTSKEDDLVYLDFDTHVPLDITYYPGRDKIGIFGDECAMVLRKSSAVGLYDGEE